LDHFSFENDAKLLPQRCKTSASKMQNFCLKDAKKSASKMQKFCLKGAKILPQ